MQELTQLILPMVPAADLYGTGFALKHGGIILALGVLAILVGNSLKRRIRRSERLSLQMEFVGFLTPLVPPTLAILLLSISYGIAKFLDVPRDIFLFGLKLSIAWLAIRFVMQMTSRQSAGWVIVLVIVPITLLHLFNIWLPVEKALLALQFQVASVKLNAYVVLKSLMALTVLFWVSGGIVKFISTRIARMHSVHISHRTLMQKMFQFLLYFVACVVALQMLGIDLTALSVMGGAIGVGIGFGLQKIASNFISGIILLLEKSVQIGDLVELQDGTAGFIRNTSARYTLMETLDGREILLPNEDLITQRMISWTHSNTHARVEILLSVSYDADVEKARQIMLKAAQAHPKALKDPEPFCCLTEFAENGIGMLLHFWIPNVVDGRKEPKSDVMIAILKRFREENIVMPYPQRVVHMANNAARVA